TDLDGKPAGLIVHRVDGELAVRTGDRGSEPTHGQADYHSRPCGNLRDSMTLADLVRQKKIVVCVGSGGVGKTTTAATLGQYAAMAKLHTLDQDPRWDLIILDTPPTANALDFLDAPRKLTDAIDSPAIQWFIKPYMKAGRFSLKLIGRGGAFVLKRLGRFVG